MQIDLYHIEEALEECPEGVERLARWLGWSVDGPEQAADELEDYWAAGGFFAGSGAQEGLQGSSGQSKESS